MHKYAYAYFSHAQAISCTLQYINIFYDNAFFILLFYIKYGLEITHTRFCTEGKPVYPKLYNWYTTANITVDCVVTSGIVILTNTSIICKPTFCSFLSRHKILADYVLSSGAGMRPL